MIRYQPARHYLSFGVVALALAVFSGWLGLSWAPGFIPCGLFLLSAAALLILAFQPAIELHAHHLAIGKRVVHWMDIRRVDRTRWESPLVVRLTLFDDSRLVLVYPGEPDACQALLRHLRRASRDALIDGLPYRQYWGEMLAASPDGKAPRYRMLRPEDEAEVERLYQRLRTVGRLDQKTPPDEK
ncbi:MAG: hypothetical protein HYR60_20445 [Acidobacteria bacterium]|nr:hypothetical protein [Acidobacteriota bacterium]MBI3470103.1 hypothetical protein [Candidatus Solibacter usitatus]